VTASWAGPGWRQRLHVAAAAAAPAAGILLAAAAAAAAMVGDATSSMHVRERRGTRTVVRLHTAGRTTVYTVTAYMAMTACRPS
jgi:hypothetical protein